VERDGGQQKRTHFDAPVAYRAGHGFPRQNGPVGERAAQKGSSFCRSRSLANESDMIHLTARTGSHAQISGTSGWLTHFAPA